MSEDSSDAVRSRVVPFVEYLVLDGEPHLEVNECTACGARYFDRRNACANCGGDGFLRIRLPTDAEVKAFTIVCVAAPEVEVPYVAAIVDCGGTTVRANLVNVAPDARHLRLGMRVRLVAVPIGVDVSGTQAVGFGFEPSD